MVVGLSGGVFGTLVLVGALAAWHDLRPARAQILSASTQLEHAGDPSALATPERRQSTRDSLASADGKLAAAQHRIDHSVAISIARFIPGLRRQRAGLITLVGDARRGSAAALGLIDSVQALGQAGRLHDGAIPLDGLRDLAAEAGRAGRVFSGLERSPAGLIGPLAGARRRVNTVATSAGTTLDRAAEAMGAAGGFLGGGGERRYVVALQNNAEMRDQGAVLSYAVMHVADGRFQIERRGSVADLRLTQATATPIPAGTSQVFGDLGPTRLWQSVNATADFEWSARAMVDMYRQATGQSIDGVMAIDVPCLAALLGVVGPLQIPGLAQPITAQNAPRVLLHDLYEGLGPHSDQAERRERLADVIEQVVTRLTTGNRDIVNLGSVVAKAASGGHFRLWSSAPDEEATFVRTGLGGGPGAIEADRTFHVAVENRTATKLDYYVKPTVRQDVEVKKDGTAVVRTTVVVRNDAPVGAPASYALGPDKFTSEPGEYLAWFILWGPAGSQQASSTPESGLVLSQHVATVDAGQTREVSWETTIPRAVSDGHLTLRLVPQARLEPMPLEVHLRAPGWHIVGSPDWRGPWDQVRRLSWGLRR